MTAVAPARTGLPDLIIETLAAQIVDAIEGHGPGHCVRIDSIRSADAELLALTVRAKLADPTEADVHVLGRDGGIGGDRGDGLVIPAERAVELRNRKERPLVLMVPVGSGASASSLDNSFARIDVAALLTEAGENLVADIGDPELRDAVRRAGRELGRDRPVEAWARYVAAVLDDPTWDTVGRALWMVGLIPDLGEDTLVERLSRNARCVRTISRPLRAVASVEDRLTSAGVPEGPVRERIAGYLVQPQIDLSDVTAWAGLLAEPEWAGVLTFEQWPHAQPAGVPVTSLRVDTFLKEDGALRTGTRLKQDGPGELPYLEIGDDAPASVTVVWKTDPAKTTTIDRWLLEVVPPLDLRDDEAEPFARQTVKGDKRRATVRIELAEEDVAAAALLLVRVTALDDTGQPLLLVGGKYAVAESEQFAVRWEAEPGGNSGGRRASARSMAQARLDAALDGQDDLTADAPVWDGGAYSVRLGGRRTVRLALSPALVELQRVAFSHRGATTAWEAQGRLGEVLHVGSVEPVPAPPLPQTLAERRRRLFDELAHRRPHDVVEAIEWDPELRAEVNTYCQTYRRALDAATDPATRRALLTMDTLMLSVATAGHRPIASVVVLPFHPMRLAWAAEHSATLGAWARELSAFGRSTVARKQAVDARLVARVVPANLPFAVFGADGSPFVYVREATLGTGLYLDPGEAEPGAAVQAVFDVLGLDRRDVTPEVPASVLAERIEAYRVVNPGQSAMRLLAYNPGSGDLLARALSGAVLGSSGDEDDLDPAPARIEVTAYSSRPSFTDPLPALTDLQRRVAARQVRGATSYLTPPLGVGIRDHDRLVTDTQSAHLAFVADLAVVAADAASEASDVAVQDPAASFRNLLTPASNQRAAVDGDVVWRTAPALRARVRDGASDAVDAHRSYQAALAAEFGYSASSVALAARLGAEQRASLRAAHERADWVLTLDRNLGVDLFTGPAGETDPDRPYILDYAPDFLEGLGPRLTVTTTHRGEVERLLADAMAELDLATVDESVREILNHLQVVSGRLAMRLIGRSNLATEAVSLAALMAHLRRRGELDGTVVVPVDAHMDVFGESAAEAGARRCDVILVRSTARTLRLDCVEVKSRKAAALPTALVDDIVEQLDSTVGMLQDTFFRTDPPRIDAELQRARLSGILRHHADRALAMNLLDPVRRSEVERLFERVEDGTLVPEIGQRGYVVSLGGEEGFPQRHRGVRIDVLTAADLGAVGFSARLGSAGGPADIGGASVDPTSPSPGTGSAPEASESAPMPGAPAPRRDPSRSESSHEPSQTDSSRPDPSGPTSARPSPRPRPPSVPDEPRTGSSAETTSPLCPVTPLPGRRVQHPDPARVPAPPAAPLSAPPGAGSGRAHPESVEVVLGQDANAGQARWRISTAGSPHLFVLGIPGQGKSVTTRHILNSFADQGLPALVLDFHGDMAAEPAGGAAVLDATGGLPFSPFELRDGDHNRYQQAAWELSEVIGYVCALGEIQRNAVYEGLRDVYRARGFGSPGGPDGLPTMEELAEAVVAVESTGRGRNVVARLRPLSDFGLFTDAADRSFPELLQRGLVLDVHGLMEQVQIAAGAFVLRKVYREMFQWGQSSELRLAVVLDEAHRLAKDVTLPKIMKEGRKYGVAVVVASQGVADFHKDVLSNAGTKVAFRCNFPQSRTVAGFMRGRAGQDLAVALENLSVGQAYVSTPERAEARKVFMARD